MNSPTIFGREPAVIVGLIQAVLALAVSFGVLAFVGIKGQVELGIVMGVVIAVLDLYVTYVTRRALLAAAIGLVKALGAFVAIYGYALTVEQTGSVIAVLTFGLALFHQSQTEPLLKADHSFDLAA
jgi:hypothetical protein